MSRPAVIARCHRLGPLVLSLLVLTQIAIGLHKVDHTSPIQDTPCPLCVTADHLAGPPPAKIAPVIVFGADEPTAVSPQLPAHDNCVSPYESRAPPKSS